MLGNILGKRGNLGDEVKGLYKRSMAIYMNQEGPDGINTAVGNTNLGRYHLSVAEKNLKEKNLNSDKRKEHLLLSVSYYKESLRIYTKAFGRAHHESLGAASELSIASHILSKA
jgi:hypothetical protein